MSLEKQPLGAGTATEPGETAAQRTARGTRVVIGILVAGLAALVLVVVLFAVRGGVGDGIQDATAEGDGRADEYGEDTSLAESPAPVQGIPEVGTADTAAASATEDAVPEPGAG